MATDLIPFLVSNIMVAILLPVQLSDMYTSALQLDGFAIQAIPTIISDTILVEWAFVTPPLNRLEHIPSLIMEVESWLLLFTIVSFSAWAMNEKLHRLNATRLEQT